MEDMSAKHPVERKSPADRREHTHIEEGNWFVPAVDIYESDETMVIVADMPGVSQNGLELVLEQGELVVTGWTSPLPESEKPLDAEYEVGNYHRHFAVYGVDEANVTASMADGVLTIVLPKKAEFKPRRIEIR
jgi:HSP20 family protein